MDQYLRMAASRCRMMRKFRAARAPFLCARTIVARTLNRDFPRAILSPAVDIFKRRLCQRK